MVAAQDTQNSATHESTSAQDHVRISVILPVYNVEPYIGRCIESLQAQTLDGLEFIFVDDCSSDDSMSAVEAWAAQDARVRILRNEENLGAGLSRNRGMEAARGDYLGFVDPDDYISSDFYQLLYAAAIADGGHDIAKGFRQKEKPETGWGGQGLNYKIRTRVSAGEPLYTLFTYEHQTAIYKRWLYEAGARNGTTRKAQDTTFLLSVGLLTDDIVFEANAKYFYLRREGSAVNTNSYQRYVYELDALEEKAELLDEREYDTYVRSYLQMIAEGYLTNYHSGLLSNPELANKLEDYRTYLSGVIDKHPSLEFLSDESAVARALLTHGVSLARVGSLPFDQVIEGAQIWIDFTYDHLDEAGYLGECAFNMAAAIQKLTGTQGASGFKSALSQLAQRASRLPVRQRTLLWAKTLRRLATRINARKAYERIKNKLGRK